MSLLNVGFGGDDVLVFGAQFASTPLICAAASGHADCARLLLDAGADKEASNLVRTSRFARVPSCVGDEVMMIGWFYAQAFYLLFCFILCCMHDFFDAPTQSA